MDKLAEIMAAKRREIAPRLRPIRDDELLHLARMPRSAPSHPTPHRPPAPLALLAEIKRRSPSAGAIAAHADAVEQARRYVNAGVDAMSILTDETYFGGSLRDLWDVAEFLEEHPRGIPCLRKDFMVHPVQVVEAAEAGARAILIIVRALADPEIAALHRASQLAGLDAIFEIHDVAELDRALAHQPAIIGVNNRDLARFRTDLALSERLLPQIPSSILRLSESGISTPEDAARVRAAGADAILVGEALMRLQDPADLEALVQSFHQIA